MTQRCYINLNKISEPQIVENFLLMSLFNQFEAEIMYKKTLACMEYICEDSA